MLISIINIYNINIINVYVKAYEVCKVSANVFILGFFILLRIFYQGHSSNNLLQMCLENMCTPL
jgi:hypothetical protein